LFLALAGCGGITDRSAEERTDDQACDTPDLTQVAVITEMWFARIDEAGLSAGIDLDGVESACGVEDVISPDGQTGIDNSFGTLIPILELTEGAAIEVYIQNLINQGEILIMIELEDVDDPLDDGCVNCNLLRGLGEPTVGTDKIIEAGQTFDRNPDLPSSRTEATAINDGTLLATPLEFELPFNIFDVEVDFKLHEATLRFDQGVDGHHAGFIAGGIYVADILEFVESRNDIDIGDLVSELTESRADLWPDDTGRCTGISVVFEYRAKPAFFYAE